MRRVVLLVLVVVFATAACGSGEPATTYTVRIESGFGGPVTWTSVVDNGARDGGTVMLVGDQSAGINLALTPGQRASVQVAIPPNTVGYATCQAYLGEQPLAQPQRQVAASPTVNGTQPPATCEVVAR